MTTETLSPLEQKKREKLLREKPQVYEKVIKIKERYEQGIPTPIVDIAYNYACNFHCNHCCVARYRPKEHKLDIPTLKRFTDECDQLGLCQLILSGGEPLVLKDVDKVLQAMQPDKFHLAMSTNGYFLDADMAKRLKDNGLDKIRISVDNFNEEEHDQNRNCVGAYKRAMAAIDTAVKAGLSVEVSTVVTHQNCQTGELDQLAQFVTEKGLSLEAFIARAIGAWEGKHEVLIDQDDAKYIADLHEKYPSVHRDTLPSYGMKKGCGCVNATLHLTQYGDILPCVYMQIGIGNIFEESLKSIIDRGMSIKHFKNYSPICLTGEDRNFINKYMTKIYGKPLPLPWQEAFTEEDFV